MIGFVQTAPAQCRECGNPSNLLWPLNGGICNECLVKNFDIEDALRGVCPCKHADIRELFNGIKK